MPGFTFLEGRSGRLLNYDAASDEWAALRGAANPLKMGQVGCRSVIADQLNAGVAQSIQRRGEFARDDITSLRLVYGNYYVDSDGAEKSGAGTRDVRASIEYPAGVFTQVKFSGNAQGTLANAQARMESDDVIVSIPRGAQFWVNTWQNSAGGILFSAGYTAFGAIGDQGTVGASVPDTTMQTWSGTAGGNPYGPYAIIAMTRRSSAAVVGDSRGAGTGQTSNSVAYAGEIMPQVAPFMGAINLSRGSQTVQQLATGSFAKRAELLQYVTIGIMQPGTNDIQANARTAAQVIADRLTVRGFAPTLKWWQTTIGPKTTSSDSWATLTNQTLDGTNSIRVAFNDLVRGGGVGFDGFFDMADSVESARNSGKWKAPPMTDGAITADGNHSNNAGYALNRPYLTAASLGALL